MALEIRDIRVTALHNTHALQALQIMERQIERIEHYPEIKATRSHVKETLDQRDRLEAALAKSSESHPP